MQARLILIIAGFLSLQGLQAQCPTTSKPVNMQGDNGIYLKAVDGTLEENVPVGHGFSSGSHPICGAALYTTFTGRFATKKETGVGVQEIKYQMELQEKSFSGSTWKKMAESFTETQSSSGVGSVLGPERVITMQSIVQCGHMYKGIIKFKVKRKYTGWAVDWDKLTTNTWNIYDCVPPAGTQVSLNQQIGDFNGDGKTDLLFFGGGVVSVAINKGYGFNGIPSWLNAPCGSENYWVVGDFNHDGKDDLLGTYNDGTKVFLSTGTSFLPGKVWTTAGNGEKGWYVGNFGGDKNDDILRYQGSSGVEVFLSDGTKFVSAGIWSTAGAGDIGWQVGDFNGDEIDDIMRLTGPVQVLISTGHSFNNPVNWATGLGYGLEQYWVTGKFNNDKSVDLLRTRLSGSNYGIDVSLSNNNAFGMISQWAGADFKNTIPIGYAGDFNGDGLTDVLKIGTGIYIGKYLIYISNGTSFNSPIVWTL